MADDAGFFRKRPTQSRSRSVVNAIISAADQLLERNEDPSKVSLEGVARRAGVGIGSLYDYFANREGVLGALVSHITEANFAALERELEQTAGLPFRQANRIFLDKALDTYLTNPARTRGIVGVLIRLDWIKPVVRERDRFARLLAKRMVSQHPSLDSARIQLAAEVVCDCVMGVAVSELWRDRTPAELLRARAELHHLVDSYLDLLLTEG